MKYLLCKGGLKAGLGDLIRALITAVAYAKLTNRYLCVDWRNGVYGMPPKENLFEKIFKLKKIKYYPGIPDSGTVHPEVWNNSLLKSFDQIRKDNDFLKFDRDLAIHHYSVDYSKLEYENDILVIWDFDNFESLISPLVEKNIIEPTDSAFHAMGQIFNNHIEFQPEVKQFLEHRWSEIFENYKGSGLLGVHVRETKESFNLYKPISRKKYLRAIDSILNDDEMVSHLFLATDNINVEKKIFNKYGSKVLTNKKWFNDPGRPLHLGLDDCSDKWGNILNALFDIYALSRCDYLIRRSESSFSYLAQCIGLFEEKNVRIIHKERTMKQKLSTVKHTALKHLNQTKKKMNRRLKLFFLEWNR